MVWQLSRDTTLPSMQTMLMPTSNFGHLGVSTQSLPPNARRSSMKWNRPSRNGKTSQMILQLTKRCSTMISSLLFQAPPQRVSLNSSGCSEQTSRSWQTRQTCSRSLTCPRPLATTMTSSLLILLFCRVCEPKLPVLSRGWTSTKLRSNLSAWNWWKLRLHWIMKCATMRQKLQLCSL